MLSLSYYLASRGPKGHCIGSAAADTPAVVVIQIALSRLRPGQPDILGLASRCPLSPSARPPGRRQKNGNKPKVKGKEQKEIRSKADLARRSPPRSHHPLHHTSARGAIKPILSTHVPLRNLRPGVALLFPNMTLTDGATGSLFSYRLRILFHITPIWLALDHEVKT